MKSTNKIVAILACLAMIAVPLTVLCASDDTDTSASSEDLIFTIHYENYKEQKVFIINVAFDAQSVDRPGYTLNYWTGPEGQVLYPGKTYNILMFDDKYQYVYLTGSWTPHTYTATFKDGSTTVGTKSVTYDSSIGSLPSASSKAGYTFVGWSPTGSASNIISSSTVYKVDGNQTYYAVWKESTYKVSLVDGDTTYSTLSCTYKSPIGNLPVLKREGYSFMGWSYNREGTQMVRSDTIYDRTGNSTLYAVWAPNVYSITLMSNGTEFGTKYVSYNSNVGELPEPTLKGKRFLGWSLDGSKSSIISSDFKYTYANNISLYAVFEDCEYNVTFDTNGGGAAPAPIKCKYNCAFGDLPTVSCKGKNFLGWSLTKDGTSMVTADSMFMQTSDATLYAIYDDIEYTISFDPNGGTTTPSPIKCRYQSEFGVLPTVSCPGKTFMGWSLTPDGKSMVTSHTILSKADDITLYAVYTDTIYTVSFDPNGGDTTPSPIKCKYKEAFGNLPTVSCEGKTFKGWSTTADGKYMVTDRSVLSTPEDITLYAIWEEQSPIDHGTTSNDIGFSLTSPLSIAILLMVVGATMALSYWIYRRGMI